MLKSNLTKEVRKVNLETGILEEVIEKKYYKTERVDKPYIKTYSLFMEIISERNLDGGILRTFLNIAHLMSYDNIIILDKGNKEKIIMLSCISVPTLKRHLKFLIETDFLRLISKGRYMVNPFYVGKGREKEIRELELKYLELNENML